MHAVYFIENIFQSILYRRHARPIYSHEIPGFTFHCELIAGMSSEQIGVQVSEVND